MPLVRRPRVVPLAAAALLAVGIGGVSLADSPKKTLAPAAGLAAPRPHGWNWSVSIDGGRTVEVRARRCPKQYPRKVGSFSYSTTRIVNGKVEHHSAKGSVCAK